MFLGKLIRFLYHLTYKLIPVNNKYIIFISFHGRGYSDNPKAIYEYLTTYPEYQGYKFIWAIKHHKQKNIEIPGAKIIEYFSFAYFYYLAKAKYWVINCKLPTYIVKKPNQIYLQTWHGTPLKRLAYDIEVSDDTTFYRSQVSKEQMQESYRIDVARYNYMISPSSFTTEVFQSAFRIDKERLIETGYPRNDILSNYPEELAVQIKERIGIKKNKKVILYAPTWRDNSFELKGYTFKLEVDFYRWREILGEDYVVIFKPHYLISNDFDLSGLKDFVYQIDASQDINLLYIVSDILITDYSSVFFDYAILKRPIYFYMYDLASYQSDLRGFYLDIYKDLPGEILKDETSLLNKIKNNDYDFSKLISFNQRFNNHEDGFAAKRVVDILLKDAQK